MDCEQYYAFVVLIGIPSILFIGVLFGSFLDAIAAERKEDE